VEAEVAVTHTAVVAADVVSNAHQSTPIRVISDVTITKPMATDPMTLVN
jgi:hypothetical protein